MRDPPITQIGHGVATEDVLIFVELDSIELHVFVAGNILQMVVMDVSSASIGCLIIQDQGFLQGLLQGQQEASAIQAYHGLKRPLLHSHIAEYHH